ncbi:MAG: hypothetical protein ACXAB7_15700 [Candidatus Kariarchaeaceae archaeon]
MSFLDTSFTRTQWLKFFVVLSHWTAFVLILYALTQPIILLEDQFPIYLIWDMNQYGSGSFNEISTFGSRYFLIILLSLLAALRSESADLSSKFLSIITILLLIEFYIYMYDLPLVNISGVTADALDYIISANILIILGLILSFVYNIFHLREKEEERYINDLYPDID